MRRCQRGCLPSPPTGPLGLHQDRRVERLPEVRQQAAEHARRILHQVLVADLQVARIAPMRHARLRVRDPAPRVLLDATAADAP